MSLFMMNSVNEKPFERKKTHNNLAQMKNNQNKIK